MTIPALVVQNQQKAWDTAANLFERRLESALKTMNTQLILSGYKTTEDFVNELQKHMKITKICNKDKLTECVSENFIFEILNIESASAEIKESSKEKIIETKNLKTSGDIGQSNWNTDVVGLQFNNGSTALLAYNPECKQDPYNNQFSGLECVAVVYDINGYGSPDTQGKDMRLSNATLTKCDFMIDSNCMSFPFKATKALTKAECEAKQSELQIKYCPGDNDYFAGTAETCGGVSKMARLHNELFVLQRFLYHVPKGSGSQYFVGTSNEVLDIKNASKVGLKIDTGAEIRIMSSSEHVDSRYPWNVYYRNFKTNTYNWYQTSKSSSNFYAMCKYGK